MEKALKLYNSQGAFPSAKNQIEILGFNYDAKRMGGAPTISATIIHDTCLDKLWADDVYVEFNGEKYYLKQIPTSSFSNNDARFKHECLFVSERIMLDNVFFFDTVVGDPQSYDKPVSNSSVFTFFGNIREFATRLNASLQYSKLQSVDANGVVGGYVVKVDSDVDNEEKLMSFSNVPFSSALQESYNQYKIPYYFTGKEIHFGYWQNNIKDSFRYGVDKELLSITKTNANQKVVTRCTGIGGTENIPYYYPNKHPQGELAPLYNEKTGLVSIEDDALFSKNVLFTNEYKYTSYQRTNISGKSVEYYEIKDFKDYKSSVSNKGLVKNNTLNEDNWFLAPKQNWTDSQKEEFATSALGNYEVYSNNAQKPILLNEYNSAVAFRITFSKDLFIPIPTTETEIAEKTFRLTLSGINSSRLIDNDINLVIRDGAAGYDVKFSGYKITKQNGVFVWSGTFSILSQWFDKLNYDQAIYLVLKTKETPRNGISIQPTIDIEFESPKTIYTWRKGDRDVELSELGLSLSKSKKPIVGDIITFRQVRYVQPMPNLMPPIYWESNGAERFYNALNNTYDNPETGDKYTFVNPYRDSKRVEHIVEFPDIKPTIEDMTNNAGQPINAFLEFAYDEEDNDAVDQNGNYIHPYFYAKLPKFDSFNLFTHANEKGEVTFSMTSGNCGACNFVLGVDSETGKNTVQVDSTGVLKRTANGDVIRGGVPQSRQNDTKNNEVWIALKKDNSTYGTIMPSAQHKYYPKPCTKNADGSYNADGDTFVLLNITMPVEYVKAAEKRLRDEIIRYMYENNMEKFSFSIKFSRIYFAEHPELLKRLNENSLITIEYNGETLAPFYVNSFAYKMAENEPLPEITVELTDTLSSSQNALQTAVSQVKADMLDRFQKMDIAALVASKFLSKNDEDYAKQKITFNRGLNIGTQDETFAGIDQTGHADLESLTLRDYISTPNFRDGFSGEGFQIWLDKNGLSHLTVDVLTARQRMVIYEMLISKIRSVNGQLWVTAANGTIAKVVEQGDDFEITFEDENTFLVGDFMRCQVFRGASLKSYWVEIKDVDGNRVYVAKSEFNGVLPQAGDDVILCGSKDLNRQNAIHISATEDGQPRISIYNGISSKSLVNCLRTQVGNLDNIKDEAFGESQPQGDGLYSDNAYLKGDFILRKTGESVETRFEVTDGNIKSAVGTLQDDASNGKTLLYNPSFAKGVKGWITNARAKYYTYNGLPIFIGDSAFVDSTNGIAAHYLIDGTMVYVNGRTLVDGVTEKVESKYNDSRFYFRLYDGEIKQLNDNFINKPDINGFVPITLELKIDVSKEGVLYSYIDEVASTKATTYKGISDKEYLSEISISTPNGAFSFSSISETIGEEDVICVSFDNGIKLYNLTRKREVLFDTYCKVIGGVELNTPISLFVFEAIKKTKEYIHLKFETKWDGIGNFVLGFTGDAKLYSLQLYTDNTEVRYSTLFEQTERVISATAAMYGENNELLKKSGLVVQAEGAGLYAKDKDGNQAIIATYTTEKEGSKILLEGNKIQLKGDLTVDGKFKVREDGSIEARNGLFSGIIRYMPLIITDETRELYMESVNTSNSIWRLKQDAFTNIILYKVQSDARSIQISLPSRTSYYTDFDMNFLRGLVGQKCAIYNYRESAVTETADITLSYAINTGNIKVDTLPKGCFSVFECVLGLDANNNEWIYWEKTTSNGNISDYNSGEVEHPDTPIQPTEE